MAAPVHAARRLGQRRATATRVGSYRGALPCAAPRTRCSFRARAHSAGPCTGVEGGGSGGNPTPRRWRGRGGGHVLAHVALGGGVEGRELHVAGVLGPHLGKHLLKGVEAAVRGVDVVLVHLRGAGRQRGGAASGSGVCGGVALPAGCTAASREATAPAGRNLPAKGGGKAPGRSHPLCADRLPPAQQLQLPSEASLPGFPPRRPLPSCSPQALSQGRWSLPR